ncbi:kynureninase-like [Watersipora subatra]|uniref:kynureninase-like n=1 Tax=Watersipora subatra TaxID=2589382 RepID=UPI00355BEA5B
MDKELVSELEANSKEYGVDLTSKEFAIAMDTHDPVGYLRDLFYYPKMKDLPKVDPEQVEMEEDCVYFCGNSLGLCPKSAGQLVSKEIDRWSRHGVYGHLTGDLPWAECDLCIDEQMATIVGAKREEVSLMNGLTVNLHLLMLSFYQPTPKRHKILLEAKAFPSDHYAVESQIELRGFDTATSMLCLSPREGEKCLRTEDIIKTIEDDGESIAVIMLSGVQYYTGQLFDMPAITRTAQEKGIMVGYDLAHAVGNVPLHLHDWGVDFACWCSYKYLCSGAGGIGGAFVHEKHAHSVKPALLGWWGHKGETRFAMENEMDLIPGVQGFRLSNPPGLLCASLKACLEVYDKTSLEELRAKSRLLTGYLEWMIRHYFSKEAGSSSAYIEIFTPSSPTERGCQLSLCFSIPLNVIFQKLTECGVVCDERLPHVLRVAPVHLYNSFLDVYRFIQILRKLVIENPIL